MVGLGGKEGTMEKKMMVKKQLNNNHQNTPRFASHSTLLLFSAAVFAILTTTAAAQPFDYADALAKSLLYFESQRSGRLPYNQRVTWRDNSGLTDGLEQGVCPHSLNAQKLGFSFFFRNIVLSWNVICYCRWT